MPKFGYSRLINIDHSRKVTGGISTARIPCRCAAKAKFVPCRGNVQNDTANKLLWMQAVTEATPVKRAEIVSAAFLLSLLVGATALGYAQQVKQNEKQAQHQQQSKPEQQHSKQQQHAQQQQHAAATAAL